MTLRISGTRTQGEQQRCQALLASLSQEEADALTYLLEHRYTDAAAKQAACDFLEERGYARRLFRYLSSR